MKGIVIESKWKTLQSGFVSKELSFTCFISQLWHLLEKLCKKPTYWNPLNLHKLLSNPFWPNFLVLKHEKNNQSLHIINRLIVGRNRAAGIGPTAYNIKSASLFCKQQEKVTLITSVIRGILYSWGGIWVFRSVYSFFKQILPYIYRSLSLIPLPAIYFVFVQHRRELHLHAKQGARFNVVSSETHLCTLFVTEEEV